MLILEKNLVHFAFDPEMIVRAMARTVQRIQSKVIFGKRFLSQEVPENRNGIIRQGRGENALDAGKKVRDRQVLLRLRLLQLFVLLP